MGGGLCLFRASVVGAPVGIAPVPSLLCSVGPQGTICSVVVGTSQGKGGGGVPGQTRNACKERSWPLCRGSPKWLKPCQPRREERLLTPSPSRGNGVRGASGWEGCRGGLDPQGSGVLPSPSRQSTPSAKCALELGLPPPSGFTPHLQQAAVGSGCRSRRLGVGLADWQQLSRRGRSLPSTELKARRGNWALRRNRPQPRGAPLCLLFIDSDAQGQQNGALSVQTQSAGTAHTRAHTHASPAPLKGTGRTTRCSRLFRQGPPLSGSCPFEFCAGPAPEPAGPP